MEQETIDILERIILNYKLIAIISGIIILILIVCFFRLCHNVKKIKHVLSIWYLQREPKKDWICPKCGENNPGNSPKCRKCNYIITDMYKNLDAWWNK